jgi:hypothetical protein
MAKSQKKIRNHANRRRAAMIEQAITAGRVTAAEDRAWLQERKVAQRQSRQDARRIWRKRAEQDVYEERRYLVVPFMEKDSAKALGARWDPNRRQWWISLHLPVKPFARWLPAKTQAQTQQAHDKEQWRYGTLGPAGPVRHIDPEDYRP